MINAKTQLYGIFGNPVSHSLSPVLHNAAFQHRGINAVYLAFQPSSLHEAIESMKSLPIHGASITIPFKTDVLQYIDHLDPLAEDIGAVNTLVLREGRIHGYNTDGIGVLIPLQKAGFDSSRSRILILGNGGSARAIAYTLLQEGASVILCGRNRERVSRLVNELSCKYPSVESLLFNQLNSSLMLEVDFIINTTTVGMHPDIDDTPLSTDFLMPKHTVFDIVYAPPQTRLLLDAEERGCRIIKGLEMLLHQGARQFEIWTNQKAPLEIMRRALPAL